MRFSVPFILYFNSVFIPTILIFIIEWDLEDYSFKLVAPVVRFRFPSLIMFIASSMLSTVYEFKPGIYTFPLAFSLISNFNFLLSNKLLIYSLYISAIVIVSWYWYVSFLSLISINSYFNALLNMPGFSYVPSIEYVFPEPVYPYAKIHIW